VTVPPLVGPHIQATGYRRGRARAHTPGVVPWLALHTTEGITDEIALGNFWQGRSASSHAGIGRDGGYASYVRYGDTAWTNPPVHDDTETLEICAMAGWSRATWRSFPRMLETVAHWIAWRSEVRRIPIVRREGAAIASFTPGVVDHDGINDVFHKSTHWDVGENFPWDSVLGRAIAIRGGVTEEDDVTVDELLNTTIHTGQGDFKIATLLANASLIPAVYAKGNALAAAIAADDANDITLAQIDALFEEKLADAVVDVNITVGGQEPEPPVPA
jgi:hypothetical protein